MPLKIWAYAATFMRPFALAMNNGTSAEPEATSRRAHCERTWQVVFEVASLWCKTMFASINKYSC